MRYLSLVLFIIFVITLSILPSCNSLQPVKEISVQQTLIPINTVPDDTLSCLYDNIDISYTAILAEGLENNVITMETVLQDSVQQDIETLSVIYNIQYKNNTLIEHESLLIASRELPANVKSENNGLVSTTRFEVPSNIKSLRDLDYQLRVINNNKLRKRIFRQKYPIYSDRMYEYDMTIMPIDSITVKCEIEIVGNKLEVNVYLLTGPIFSLYTWVDVQMYDIRTGAKYDTSFTWPSLMNYSLSSETWIIDNNLEIDMANYTQMNLNFIDHDR